MQIAPDAFILYNAWVKDYARERGVKSLAEQIAFCLIYGHTINSPARCFFGTLEVVRYWTEAASETTARKYLVSLENAGLIDKLTVIYKGRPRPAYRARLEEAEAYRRAIQYDAAADETSPELTPQKLTPQKLIFDPSNSEGNNIIYNINKKGVLNARDGKTAGEELAEAAMTPKEKKAAPANTFEPPTAAEVTTYLQSLGNCPNKEMAEEIAESYVNANEGMGWTRNGQPIKNWKPLAKNYLVSYIRNHAQRPQTAPRTPAGAPAAPQPQKETIEAQKSKILAFYEAMKEANGEEAAAEMVEKDVARRDPEIRQWWRNFTRTKEQAQ